MALKKTYESSDGHVSEYFRISWIHLDKKVVDGAVDMYKDQASRDGGKQPVKKGFMTFHFELSDEQFDEPQSSVYEYAYDYLKTLEPFTGAEDV